MRKDFDSKVVFITGASSGIGEALARELSARGAGLALAARRIDRLTALAAELTKTGALAQALACDVTVDGSCEDAVKKAVEQFGRVDVVVANAGFGVTGNVEKLALDDFRRQFETNVFGVLRTVYASLDELKRNKGTLVLVGSVSSYVALPTSAPYSMSKFAVRALAEALTGELAAHGVSVVLINPGFVESEIRHVNNQGVLKESTRHSVPGWITMPADVAAKDIADAIAARRREEVITAHGKLAVLVQRHLPGVVASAARLSAKWKPKRKSA